MATIQQLTYVDIDVDDLDFDSFEKIEMTRQWIEDGDIDATDLDLKADYNINDANAFMAEHYDLTTGQVELALKLASRFIKGEL